VELTPSTIGALVVVAIVIGIVAVGLAIVAIQGQRRVRESYARFSLGRDDDVLTSLARHIDEVEALRAEVGDLHGYADTLRGLIARGLSRTATVRYDAYDDMGGRMSFSTALLDEHADGVILTSINGRAETRTYAKTVAAGESEHNLSGEEREAIRLAMSGQRGALRRARGRGPKVRRTRRDAQPPAPADAGTVAALVDDDEVDELIGQRPGVRTGVLDLS